VHAIDQAVPVFFYCLHPDLTGRLQAAYSPAFTHAAAEPNPGCDGNLGRGSGRLDTRSNRYAATQANAPADFDPRRDNDYRLGKFAGTPGPTTGSRY
jgi:hypothetical protein